MAASARSAQVHEVLEALGFGDITLVGVAKGPDRKPGQERLFVLRRRGAAHSGGAFAGIAARSSGFATRRIALPSPATGASAPGATTSRCSKRSRAWDPRSGAQLLKHFGGLQGVMRAGVADLGASRRNRRIARAKPL